MLTESQSAVDLTDSFVGISFKNEITKSLSHNLPGQQTDTNDSTLVSDHFPSSSVEEEYDIRPRSQLSEEQQRDPEFHLYFKKLLVKKIWRRILSVVTLKMENWWENGVLLNPRWWWVGCQTSNCGFQNIQIRNIKLSSWNAYDRSSFLLARLKDRCFKLLQVLLYSGSRET